MAIKQELNLYDFRTQFHNMDRGEQFSYEGLTALYEYLEQLSDDIEEDIAMDVIAFCCDYMEGTIEEHCDNYGINHDNWLSLEDNTTVIYVDDPPSNHENWDDIKDKRIIIQNY